MNISSPAALVLAGNWEKPPAVGLSTETKIRVTALGVLANEGLLESAVLLGGLRGGLQDLTEAEAMKSYLDEQFPDNGLAVVTESDCWDTRSSARRAAELADTTPTSTWALLTSKTHMRRAVKSFKAEGVKVEPVVAELVLLELGNQEQQRMATDYLSTIRYYKWVGKEAVMRTALILDRQGKLSERLAGSLRAGNRQAT